MAAPRRQCFGLTIIEVVVMVTILAVLVAVIIPFLARPTTGCGPSFKDKVQSAQIHKSLLVFASENNGRIPTPGMASAVCDHSLNHSAPFYSYMIAQNLFNADLLVGPTEVKPAVRVKEDYNYDAYNPAAGSFWDPTFQVRIDNPKIGSNASYAHAANLGDNTGMKWNRRDWRNAQGTGFAVIGTRGPRDGATSGPEYTRSPTIQLHGSNNQWRGHIVFDDNHVETLNSFIVKIKDANGKPVNDNLFKADLPDERGNRLTADSFLGIFIGSSEFTVDPIYDPLD